MEFIGLLAAIIGSHICLYYVAKIFQVFVDTGTFDAVAVWQFDTSNQRQWLVTILGGLLTIVGVLWTFNINPLGFLNMGK